MGNAVPNHKCCGAKEELPQDEKRPRREPNGTSAQEETEEEVMTIAAKPGIPVARSSTADAPTDAFQMPSAEPPDWIVDPDKLEQRSVSYRDTSTYCGQVLDWRREGHGVYESDAEQYAGQWHADKQHGSGRQTWSDGRSFEGQFRDGRFSGKGHMRWQTATGAMVYEGEYANDAREGVGRFAWPDGRVYDGDWVKGKRHGRAVYRTARGEHKTSHWAEDRFIRWDLEPCEEEMLSLMLRS